MNRTDDHHINDERLRWLSSQDYAQSEHGLIAAELLAARGRVAALETALREIVTEGKIYAAHNQLERLSQAMYDIAVGVLIAPPPHLRGPIIQAHADTNGVAPQSETVCEQCEGGGETGHVWHDGTSYSDRNPPCIACDGTGKKKMEAEHGKV